jgi:DNA-binding response OmpR family regulator
MSAKKILIVEDDANLLKTDRIYAEKAGYACAKAETGGRRRSCCFPKPLIW